VFVVANDILLTPRCKRGGSAKHMIVSCFFVTNVLYVVIFALSVETFVVNFEQFVTLPTNLIDNCIEKIYIQNNGSPADCDRNGGVQNT